MLKNKFSLCDLLTQSLHLYCLLLSFLVALGTFVAVAPRAVAAPPEVNSPVGNQSDRPKIVCFGDSITKRAYPEILADLVDAEVIKSAVGGHTSSESMKRLQSGVLDQKPDMVVILLGTNDIRVDNAKKHVPREKFRENLTAMVVASQEGGAKVILCTLPPINAEPFFKRHEKAVFDQAGGLESLIADYRATTVDVAKTNNAALVDLNSLLAEADWISPDGVHQSDRGNAIIARHIAAATRPLLADAPAPPNDDIDDVVVYGGTSAGIVAAVQVARMRKSVTLLVDGSHIGGLTAGGLGATDIGNKDVIGGLSREFYQRIATYYADDANWKHETREEFFKHRSKRTKLEEVLKPGGAMWTFEPHVARRVFDDMLRESGVKILLNQRIAKVNKEGSKIVSITNDAGKTFSGRMFIDASYEGDLMAAAGVRYTVGREANRKYDETLNGIRDQTPKNQIFGNIDPYVVQGDPTSGLIPLIQAGDGGTPGEGDHRVQAYNFRLCFTDVPENRLKVGPPKGYDSRMYELAARRAEKIVASGKEPLIKNFCNPVWMPNRKTDINNSQGISTDFIGANYKYPDADYQLRLKIWQSHDDYVRGFWYFMSNNSRIPVGLREQFQEFGPCKDEFLKTGGWSPQMYVRESRRMVSDYVMTEHNCRGKEIAKDVVGMAAYGMDSHNCQRIVKNGAARNEGDVQVHGLKPYPISFRSIVPVKSECENLVVPVCVSSSHIAYGSIRMEPVFMVLGQSSGIAAVIAINKNCAVQDLEHADLVGLLVAEGQVLKRSK